jgi:hypothetical protein
MKEKTLESAKPDEKQQDDKTIGFKVPYELWLMYANLPINERRQIMEQMRISFDAQVKHNRAKQLITLGVIESKKLTNMLAVL